MALCGILESVLRTIFNTLLPLVPHEPPASMMDMGALERAVPDGAYLRVDYLEFVHRGLDYTIGSYLG